MIHKNYTKCTSRWYPRPTPSDVPRWYPRITPSVDPRWYPRHTPSADPRYYPRDTQRDIALDLYQSRIRTMSLHTFSFLSCTKNQNSRLIGQHTHIVRVESNHYILPPLHRDSSNYKVHNILLYYTYNMYSQILLSK